ncbi:hypothetical protein E2P84_37680 [Burkholderia cepacia]|uniref:Lipoprotein n=1 Tax=Burkholderia cepacia TaxID=292 RepID=A0AAX2R9Y3_BURCE|nr:MULTISPECIES: hypothetical protein [Burkholderia cepacia complex]MCA7889962.1 hypothetical protein [Burkholderia contaminans]MDN7577287.1 hypothetical protein [Burkholderia contaminans]TES64769.1 hypothetical protein E2P84_37680 [Burkholderia cepacia]TES95602.1 hypothetical protein E3D36_38095 [Burkholderia cepacia]TEU31527.1 hypothetical protein E3D37_44795 [Burkholderia cepacia]
MKGLVLAFSAAMSMLILPPAHATPQDDESAVRQRVLAYVTKVYGNGTSLAAAATTFAQAAGELWLATARTQRYDQSMTVRAGIAEICFRGLLVYSGVSDADAAIAELEHTIASSPGLYAGELYAVAFAQQNPLHLAMPPSQACDQSGIAIP